MSRTYSKTLLSGSTNGMAIKLTGTNAGGAVTIHQAVAGTSGLDEIWLWVQNTDTTDRKVTLLWGGVTEPDNQVEYTVTAKDGLKLIVPGLLLQNGLYVKAYGAAVDVLLVYGFVNRIT